MARSFDLLDSADYPRRTAYREPINPTPFDTGKTDRYRPTFDERFGDYGFGGIQFLMPPGSKSWPSGNTISEASPPVRLAGDLPSGFRYAEEPSQAPASELPPGFRYADSPAASSPSAAPPASGPSGAGGPLTEPSYGNIKALQGRFLRSLVEGLNTLPQRATEAASTVPEGADYNPGPALEAAGLTMGGGIRRPVPRPAEAPMVPVPEAPRQLTYQPLPPEGVTPAQRAEIYNQAVVARHKSEASGPTIEMGAPPSTERIAVPAIQYKGAMYSGAIHPDAVQAAARKFGLPEDIVTQDPSFREGFVTTEGRFVGRDEASQIASRQNQFESLSGEGQGAKLYADNLKTFENPNDYSKAFQAIEESQSSRNRAMAAAIRPHINSIEAVTRRTTAPLQALQSALPSLEGALSTPGKAASVANWMRVYERAARAKFTPQAKASLDLATRNLNNNLGTDLSLGDILGGK